MIVCGTGFSSGVAMQKSSGTSIEHYESVDTALSSLGYAVDIPEYIENQKDVQAQVIAGKMLQLNNDSFVLKATMFVDEEADPLGLYGESKIDNSYKLDNDSSGVVYFRYRSGYSDYPESKFINWVKDGVAYGIMTSTDITEKDAVEMLGIENITLD